MRREQKPGAARWCELAKALRVEGLSASLTQVHANSTANYGR